MGKKRKILNSLIITIILTTIVQCSILIHQETKLEINRKKQDTINIKNK